MRDIYKSLAEFENSFESVHGVSLNEAMTLCCIDNDTLSAAAISSQTGLTNSHSSKVIRSIEEKGLIERALGDKDKRQMYFTLTTKGKKSLSAMKCGTVEIPEILKPVFDKMGCGEEMQSS